jgi:uncharacterized repeat protein (TIGR04076 family)
MIKCRITVLKKGYNEEFVDQYVCSPRKPLGPCPVFEVGQVFETEPICEGMPKGFCAWAWDDIYKSLIGLASGGNWGMWYEKPELIIACCTDGTRPVYFKIEKVES